ncbi:MAG: replicative DNA helicase [Verrucomicrobia bacterium]|nr:replicative DNA helicase [Verrucomicrobiota bacterium]
MPVPLSASAPPSAEKLPDASGRGQGRRSEANGGYSQGHSQDIHRALPHSLEAEKGLLGSMLLAPAEVIGKAVQEIDAAHFYLPAHQVIYQTLVDFWTRQQPADVITLTQALRDRGQLELVGGAALVTELFTFVPTAANATYYLEIVREKFVLRQIINTCTDCAARSYEAGGDVNELLDEVESRILGIGESRLKQKIPTMKEQVMQAIETIEQLYDHRGALTGLPTGFRDFDRMTSGLHEAEMVVIAARPSMGKTALAMNIAEHVALDGKHPVAIFSLEMSSQQLVQRLLCSRARVNLQKVRDGFLSERDFPNLTTAAAKLADSQIYIDDTAALSILDLRAKARRLKQMYGIKLIVIDYLQLLRSNSRRAQDNRQLEIAEISSGVKGLAKELEIPIIVLAQLNRNPESRSGDSKGRPRLSDLRESGSIEQDADVVGLLVREEYYADSDEEKQEAEGKALLIIAKQRNGPTGDVKLSFMKEFTRFEDRADDGRSEE